MAKLPINFRKSPEFVASFSFEDIVSGLGVITFFGIASQDSSAVDYHLITNKEVFSQPVGSRFTASPSTVEYDFDSATFNLQRTAKGTAYISLCIGGAGSTATHKVLVRLFRVDSAGAETSITSEITSKTVTQSPSDTSEMVFLPLPITETIIR